MIQKTKARLNLQNVLETGSNDTFHFRSTCRHNTSAKYYGELSLKCAVLDKGLLPAVFCHFDTSIFTPIKITKPQFYPRKELLFCCCSPYAIFNSMNVKFF